MSNDKLVGMISYGTQCHCAFSRMSSDHLDCLWQSYNSLSYSSVALSYQQ